MSVVVRHSSHTYTYTREMYICNSYTRCGRARMRQPEMRICTIYNCACDHNNGVRRPQKILDPSCQRMPCITIDNGMPRGLEKRIRVRALGKSGARERLTANCRGDRIHSPHVSSKCVGARACAHASLALPPCLYV